MAPLSWSAETSFGARNWIEATLVERVTPCDAAHSEPGALDGSMNLDRLMGVTRTCGVVATIRSQ